jgi:hypothetical protein
MSKRHHVHRRKSYGRRQHELRQRETRRDPVDVPTAGGEHGGPEVLTADPFLFLEPRGGRLRFAHGD